MTMSSKIIPLGQNQRPPCSIPLRDADLSLGNANWIKGLQAMSTGSGAETLIPSHFQTIWDAIFFRYRPSLNNRSTAPQL